MSKICELNIPCGEDRSTLVAILAAAGYKVSIDLRKRSASWCEPERDYFVIVEDRESQEASDE